MHLTDILESHWADYVAHADTAKVLIPARHWRAVEAVLSCRTARRGGEVHDCVECGQAHYCFHSCNHRSCPRCGSREQEQWSLNQQARLLPVPYYLVTLTVPEALRAAFLSWPEEIYPLFFSQGAGALQRMFNGEKWIGGQAGFITVLHTWTRAMLFHPHLHMLVPAVALAPGGCALKLPKYEEFLLPVQALSAALCEGFKAALAETYPELFAQVDSCVWEQEWVTHCKEAGRGRTALRYLAAYVKKSALSDERLLGYDAEGRVLLRWKPSGEKQWQVVALEPLEMIRRWLLHVLPKGLVRVRHYGWLAAAAGKAFLRVRYLLGMRAYRKPRPIIQAPALSSCCGAALVLIAKLPAMRGPPLSRQILRR